MGAQSSCIGTCMYMRRFLTLINYLVYTSIIYIVIGV